MGAFDPVSWEAVEATIGPPAPEVAEHVDRLQAEVEGKDPYDAVKTIHDALYADDVDRTVSSLGEPFITAYLLEKGGIIAPGDSGSEYRSLVERRPSGERLEELVWDQERTLWWIGLLVGVHPSLVTYWCYEADVPLMERNYTAESMDRIRAYRRSDGG